MNYLPQADPGGNCCDCPDRAGPCDSCAACECALPDAECPHSICVEFKLDSADTSTTDDIFEFENDDASNGFGFYFLGGSWWGYGYVSGEESAVATAPYDTWHTLMVQMSNNDLDENVTFAFFMDGAPLFSFDQPVDAGSLDWNKIFVGARFSAGGAHRTIGAVCANGNPDAEVPEGTFNFPTTDFDSLSGDAVIDGSGFLRIDGSGFGQYELGPPWCVDCVLGACCPDTDAAECETKTEAQCDESGGMFHGVCSNCEDAGCPQITCCPATATVNGFVLCDDCIVAGDGTFQVEDFNVGSSSPYTLPPDGRSGFNYFQQGDCVWEVVPGDETQPKVTLKEFLDEETCPDGTPVETQINTRVVVGHIGGTYYAMIFASPTITGFGGAHMILFYGESATKSIPNQFDECDTTFNGTTIDNIFTDYAFGDGSPGSGGKLGTVVATGGSFDLTVEPFNITDFFNTINVDIHVDGVGAEGGCDMSFNHDFERVVWTRVDKDFEEDVNPEGTTFQLFQGCGDTYFGAQDRNGVYFNTPDGAGSLGMEEIHSTDGTPCTGGDNVFLQVAFITIQPSPTGPFIAAGLTFFAQCKDGPDVICALSNAFTGDVPFPSLWEDAPGTYTIEGTNTPSGWTVNYTITVEFVA